MRKLTELRMSEQLICDFCGEPKVGRRFHCTADFLMDQTPGFLPYGSKGDWAACSACGSLIDAENWNGLLMRAVNKHSQNFPDMPRRILTDTIKHSHDLFREHYVRTPAREKAEQ